MILDNVSIPLDNHYKLLPDGSIEFKAICEEHQDVMLTVTCGDNGCVMVSQCPECLESAREDEREDMMQVPGVARAIHRDEYD